MKTHNPFQYEQFARAFRKEIEAYGTLLNLIYEQQNCLMTHNPVSLFQATLKIEEQLPINQVATANRVAFVQQLAEKNGKKKLTLNEVPTYLPEKWKSLFKSFIEEVITLRYRIKSKTQIQQKLLGEAQFVNASILQHVLTNSYTSDYKHRKAI